MTAETTSSYGTRMGGPFDASAVSSADSSSVLTTTAGYAAVPDTTTERPHRYVGRRLAYGAVAARPTCIPAPEVTRALPPYRRQRIRRTLSAPTALLFLAMAGTGALRLAVPNAYDVFLDEVDYTDLSTSIRQGHYPPHFAHEGVFLLHPPLFFLMGALWELAVRPGAGYLGVVSSLRVLVALCAIVTAGLLFGIGYRLKGRLAGVAAALLFALDPYVLRTNGRVYLETTATMFVAAGAFVLIGLTNRWRGRAGRSADIAPRHWPMTAIAGGLLMGLGVVTDELAAMITVVPLAFVLVSGWVFSRRISSVALGATLVPFGAYLCSLQYTHHLQAFLQQDSVGFERALGALRITGFNASDSPSLSRTLLSQVAQFGPTYVLVALSILAGAYAAIFRRGGLRLLGVIVICATLAVGYEVVLGSVEEQFLYILVVPGLAAVACVACELAGRVRARRQAITALVLRSLLVALCCYDLGVFAVVRSHPDNGISRVVSFFHGVGHPGIVATNAAVSTDVLRQSGVDSRVISHRATFRRDNVRYFVVLAAELQGTYGSMTAGEARWFEERGRLVFNVTEATFGTVKVYETSSEAAW